MLSNLRKIFLLILLFRFSVLAQDTTIVKLDLIAKKNPFGLSLKIPSALPKIGIALSGGGARGLAQLGALAAIEKSGLPVYLIAGTSMGSIIGGLYSAGYSIEDLKKIMFATDWNKFTKPKEVQRRELYLEQKLTEDRSVISFRLKGLKPVIPTSINTGQNISNFLNSLVFNAPLHSFDFSKFPVKFEAVASNLVTGKKVLLKKGSLTKAIRASSSVSFLLPPVKTDSLLLVDGGLVENLPVESAFKSGAEIVVAVNTISKLRKKEDLKYPWQIADQIVSIPMELLTRYEKGKADFVIEPHLGTRSNTDFSNPRKLYEEGFLSAQKIIPSLKEKFFKIFKEKLSEDSTIKNLVLPEHPNKFEKKVYKNIEPAPDTTVADVLIALYKSCDLNECKNFSVKIIRSNRKNILHLNLKLNPLITRISVSGADANNYTTVYKILRRLEGRRFSAEKVFNSLLRVLRFYRRKGLSLADVESVKFQQGLLSLKLNEGTLDSIQIKGNKHTNLDVITREIPIEAGKPFNINSLKKGLRNLQATNLFNEVEAELKFVKNKRIIVFKLREKIPGVLRFGLRIDNENYTQLLMDLRNENLFGTGTQVGLIFTLGSRRRGLTLEHKANRIFNTYFTYKFKIYRQFQDVYTYTNDVQVSDRKFSRSQKGEYRQIFTGVSLGFGTQTGKFGNLIAEFRYEQNEIKNKIAYTGNTYKLNIAAIKVNLNIDSQNRYPYPTEGFLINAYYETAQTALGSNVGYSKFSLDYRNYFSPVKWGTISTRLRFGASDPTLPLSQQFSLGGQDSFFGMRDFEYRGRQIFIGSLGCRAKVPFKLFFDTYLKIRYDIGSIWAQKEEIRLKDLRHGIGATLSFDTPIGPADFSVGKSFIFKNTFKKNIISWGPYYIYFAIGVSY